MRDPIMRYPTDRQPYMSAPAGFYNYARWGDFYTDPYFYVYGRAVPFRPFWPVDQNLSARPIARVIQPTVTKYMPIPEPAFKTNPLYPTEKVRVGQTTTVEIEGPPTLQDERMFDQYNMGQIPPDPHQVAVRSPYPIHQPQPQQIYAGQVTEGDTTGQSVSFSTVLTGALAVLAGVLLVSMWRKKKETK